MRFNCCLQQGPSVQAQYIVEIAFTRNPGMPSKDRTHRSHKARSTRHSMTRAPALYHAQYAGLDTWILLLLSTLVYMPTWHAAVDNYWLSEPQKLYCIPSPTFQLSRMSSMRAQPRAQPLMHTSKAIQSSCRGWTLFPLLCMQVKTGQTLLHEHGKVQLYIASAGPTMSGSLPRAC